MVAGMKGSRVLTEEERNDLYRPHEIKGINVKEKGSEHYKTGSVEPLDLLRAGGILWNFALGSIIKYAFRNRDDRVVNVDKCREDLKKIIHYAEILLREIDEPKERDRK